MVASGRTVGVLSEKYEFDRECPNWKLIIVAKIKENLLYCCRQRYLDRETKLYLYQIDIFCKISTQANTAAAGIYL